ncbi:MAG: GntR family transcriptional regulator [Yonghaparkia sp.]|nr:GntR family transcriptional regulator [Microcella sp.]
MKLDRSGPIPLYFQIAQIIEQAVRDGDLPPGARLENEIALGNRLGLSRPTVRRAIQEVVAKGLLVRRRGIGTQVVQGQVTRGLELTSLYDDLVQSGQHPSTDVLSMEVVESTGLVSERLGITDGGPVVHLRRVRRADGAPVAILENWLPADITNLSTDDIAEHGLYQVLRSRGITMRVAQQRIGARRATPDEADILGLERGGAVLTMERTAFDGSGRAVEFGRHCYQPDVYAFEVTLVEK